MVTDIRHNDIEGLLSNGDVGGGGFVGRVEGREILLLFSYPDSVFTCNDSRN